MSEAGRKVGAGRPAEIGLCGTCKVTFTANLRPAYGLGRDSVLPGGTYVAGPVTCTIHWRTFSASGTTESCVRAWVEWEGGEHGYGGGARAGGGGSGGEW